MTNYYSGGSFSIDCTEDQANAAIQAYNELTSENVTEMLKAALDGKAEVQQQSPSGKIIRHCLVHHTDQNGDVSEPLLDWSFDIKETKSGFNISSSDGFNDDHASVFTQAFLHAFDLPSKVVIRYSFNCDKPEDDGFGGGTCIVTKDRILWDHQEEFIQAELQAEKDSEKYFRCSFAEEFPGGHSTRSHFLLACQSHENPTECLNDILLDFRGEGVQGEDGSITFECGTAVTDQELVEITPFVFTVMEEHLSVNRSTQSIG